EFSSFASSPVARPDATDMGALISEVVEPYRTGLAGRIAIETVTAPDVPTLVIDRTLFARALTNVIENALHAMPGKGQLTITTRRSTNGFSAPAAAPPSTVRSFPSGAASPAASAIAPVRPEAGQDGAWITVTTA